MLLLALLALLPQHAAPRDLSFTPVPDVRALSGRMIVRPVQREKLVAEGVSLEVVWARRAAAMQALQAYEVLRYVPQTDEYVIRIGAVGGEARAAMQLSETGNFEYVEPDWLLSPCIVATAQSPSGPAQGRTPQVLTDCPNDALFASQWHLQQGRMDACQGWVYTTGIPSVSVGICDTGVLVTHEDLQLHRLEGYNAVDQLWESQGGQIGPVHNHGTRTTGCAAANGNNGLGVSGIGRNLSHRMLRVSNLSSGGAYLTDLQHGARTAIEHGDRVASVSYSGVSSASNLTTATYIKSIGGLLVWAAGNDGVGLNQSNRDADDLIVVGATDTNDTLAYFSNFGTFVDLAAPGVNITTTDAAGNQAYTSSASGTSFATPLTSGLCAMIWSQRPWLSPSDVERLLKLGADDLGVPGTDNVFGYGRANLAGSLSQNASTVPHAALGGFPTSGASPLLVHFVDLSTGVPTSWLWDFGDGATSTLANPTHTYTTLGSYSVTLGVANSHGADTAVQPNYVLVDMLPPIAEFSGNPTSGLRPLNVSFSDQSSGGTPTSWLWNFGDGATSTLPSPAHVYNSTGYFTVSMTVTNAYGFDTRTRTSYIYVSDLPPVANFSGTPTAGTAPLVVQFSDLSSGGAPTSWLWDFGDETTSSIQNPSHTYALSGTYTVILTVGNAFGSSVQTRLNYIQAASGLTANFVGTPTSGTSPLTVNFTDLSTGGTVVAWEWDFGDGSTSTLRNPTHVYTTPGDYDVSLQVTDTQGNDDQLDRNQYITVN